MNITGRIAETGFRAFKAGQQAEQGYRLAHVWVVIADRQEAHIYHKTEKGLELIADVGSDGADVSTDTEFFDGHFSEISSGRNRHDPDFREKKKRQGDMAFIHSLAKWLDMANNEHVFDRLVLVADQHTLGRIRAGLTRNVHDRVTAELDRDLTKLPLKEIQEHLNSAIMF